VLCFAAHGVYASSVLYTFTAKTQPAPGAPSHDEIFQLLSPDFLPVVFNGPVISFDGNDPAVLSCVSCIDPPVPALHFLRGSDSDLVQFKDEDNTLRLYMFPLNALSSPGKWDTLPGINVNKGALVVTVVPEPSTAVLLTIGLGAVASVLVRRRRADKR
jgi:hypothetical protein